MKAFCIILLALVWTFPGTGQNRLDDQGRKTGPWKVEYPDGQTLYEAIFEEGRPVGEMIRYYETGAVRARVYFEPEGERSYARLYFKKDDKLAAEGLYISQQKDSVWTYYSEYDGTVRLRESYRGGKLHGSTFKYYSSGDLAEELSWEQGIRQGAWHQYYENGNLRLRGQYLNDLLNGPYSVYYGDSTLMMEGIYLDGESEGVWSYYGETGELLQNIEYSKGNPVDQEKYQELMKSELMKMDSISPSISFEEF